MKPILQYAAVAALVAGVVVGTIALTMSDEAFRGAALAAGVALPLQVVAFAVLAAQAGKGPGFLGAWVGGILLRFVAVGVVAFVVAGRESVDLVTTLLVLVGLFFVLLLLEPWMLRQRSGSVNGNEGLELG